MLSDWLIILEKHKGDARLAAIPKAKRRARETVLVFFSSIHPARHVTATNYSASKLCPLWYTLANQNTSIAMFAERLQLVNLLHPGDLYSYFSFTMC